MKNLSNLFLVALLVGLFFVAKATPASTTFFFNPRVLRNDTTPCKTYIEFKNSTKCRLLVVVYDKPLPAANELPGLAKELFQFYLSPEKSKKIVAEPDKIYYYHVSDPKIRSLEGGCTTEVFKGQISAEECKTETEEFE